MKLKNVIWGLVGAGISASIAGVASAQDGKENEYTPPSPPPIIEIQPRPQTAVVKVRESSWPVATYDEPNAALKDMADALGQGDRNDAAKKLERVRDFLKVAIDRGRLREPRDEWDTSSEAQLQAASKEMKGLIQRMASGEVPRVEALRPMFARTLLALARHHVEEGGELWLSQNGQLAGYEFRAAARDIEHALVWSEHKPDASIGSLLAEAKQRGTQLTGGKTGDKETMTRMVSELREAIRRVAADLSASVLPGGDSGPSDTARN